jgi:hypothetical protein
MGPVKLKRSPVGELLASASFWFAFPTDAPRKVAERARDNRAYSMRIRQSFPSSDH